MSRYLLLVVPLLVMTLAVSGQALELLGVEGVGWSPRAGAAGATIGGWILESVALTALYLLARGRAPSWWLDGLLAGWIGWIFRGPLLVLALSSLRVRSLSPWWQLSLSWWVLYSICGLLLALVARRLELPE